MFFVNSKPENFEHGGFTITHQMLSVHTSLEKFEKHNNRQSLWICVWGNWLGHWKQWLYRENFLSWNIFEERFRKAPFSCRISVDGRPNRRNKVAFSKFKFLRPAVWTELKTRPNNETCDTSRVDDVFVFWNTGWVYLSSMDQSWADLTKPSNLQRIINYWLKLRCQFISRKSKASN